MDDETRENLKSLLRALDALGGEARERQGIYHDNRQEMSMMQSAGAAHAYETAYTLAKTLVGNPFDR